MKALCVAMVVCALAVGCDQLRGPAGPAGPQGEQGPPGPQGEQGPPGEAASSSGDENGSGSLNTESHTEPGGFWEVLDGRVYLESASWRFLSHSVTDKGNVKVTVSYKTSWKNATTRKVKVSYAIRFRDRDGFEIAKGIGGLFDMTVILQPNGSREDSDTAYFYVGNLNLANSITEMEVGASFEDVTP